MGKTEGIFYLKDISRMFCSKLLAYYCQNYEYKSPYKMHA